MKLPRAFTPVKRWRVYCAMCPWKSIRWQVTQAQAETRPCPHCGAAVWAERKRAKAKVNKH